MKIKLVMLALSLGAMVLQAKAQRISVRLDFPVGRGYYARPYEPAPYRGAIWVGPEWRWDRGRYVSVPGYWSRPRRYNAHWSQGYWRHGRQGYVWVPGRWR